MSGATNGKDSRWYEAYQVLVNETRETKQELRDLKVDVNCLPDIKNSMNNIDQTLTDIKTLLRTNSNRAFWLAVIAIIGFFLVVFFTVFLEVFFTTFFVAFG